VLIYEKSLPDGDPGKNITYVSFSMLSSGDMSFTSALCEDQAKMDEVVKTWEIWMYRGKTQA
jgi:ketosteroid isomerase-like protein